METRVKSKAKGVWNMVALWIKTDTLYRTREPEIWSRYVPHPTTRHISHNQNISRAFRPASFLFTQILFHNEMRHHKNASAHPKASAKGFPLLSRITYIKARLVV